MKPKSYDNRWKRAGSIIRQRGNSYQVEINHNEKRRMRRTFSILAEAKTYAEQKRVEIKNRRNGPFALNDRQVQDALEVFDILHGKVEDEHLLRSRPTPLAESARFRVQHIGRRKRGQK